MIDIILPWPPRGLSPNGRLTRFPLARLKKTARAQAFYLAKAATSCVKVDDQILNVTLICRPPSGRPDEDNLTASLKAQLDGIAEAIGVDDSNFRFQPIVWEKAGRPGHVLVRITPAAGAPVTTPSIARIET